MASVDPAGAWGAAGAGGEAGKALAARDPRARPPKEARALPWHLV